MALVVDCLSLWESEMDAQADMKLTRTAVHIFIHLILFPAGVLLRAEYDVLTQLHDKTSTAVLPQYIKREEQ
jgi:hypothetical protein